MATGVETPQDSKTTHKASKDAPQGNVEANKTIVGGRVNHMGREPVPIDLSEVEQCAMLGMTKEQTAYYLGMNPSTFYEKQARFPEISEAYSYGKTKGIRFVSGKAMELVKKGNVDMTKFWLARKGDWKEEKDVNVNVTVSKEHRMAAIESAKEAIDASYEDITPEEWA